MSNIDFFETHAQHEWDFPTYLSQTHNNVNKTRLKSLKTILLDYVNDLAAHTNDCDQQVKQYAGHLRNLARYSDTQLQAISALIVSSSQPQQSQVFHIYGGPSVNGNNNNVTMAPATDNFAASSSISDQFEGIFTDDPETEAEEAYVDPNDFRDAVFQAGVSKENGTITIDMSMNLRNLVNSFRPQTLGQRLDVMAAELILKADLKDDATAMALKLSLSRLFSLLNDKIKAVFRKHFDQGVFDALTAAAPTPPRGLSAKSKAAYKEVITAAKNAEAPRSFLTRLQVAICMKKLEIYQSSPEDTEVLQILDVLANLANSIPEETPSEPSTSSELTWYRKFAQILDIILKDTSFSIDDGERICKASKNIITQNSRFHFSPRNTTFGRRIDLILTSSHVELCTNEWKREGASMSDIWKQQSKNSRMNKAVLSSLLKYPLDSEQKSKMATLSVDMTGPLGYLFYCFKREDVFVVKHMANFRLPPGLDQLDAFLDSLDVLYKWKNHHLVMQEMLTPAITRLEDAKFYSQVTTDTDGVLADNDGYQSPNVYFTPAKRRKTGLRSTYTENEES